MAYEFSCQDANADCGFVVRSENRDEIIGFAREHAREVHGEEVSESDVSGVIKLV